MFTQLAEVSLPVHKQKLSFVAQTDYKIPFTQSKIRTTLHGIIRWTQERTAQ